MTFVLARTGEKSIWLMADTRLTASSGASFHDDGVKLLALDVPEGPCLIGYAGLGSTSAGTQPSEWMARVLTGVNLTLEQSIDTIARAMTEQFPQHSGATPNRAIVNHQVVAVAFSEKRARRFIIRLVPNQIGDGSAFRWTEILSSEDQPFLATGSFRAIPLEVGSEFSFLRGWAEEELKRIEGLVKEAEEGRLPYHEVAKEFARLNYRIHSEDDTVGPKCTVIYRYRDGGGSHVAFDGMEPGGSGAMESMSHGMNMGKICEILLEHMSPIMSEMMRTGDNAPIFPEAEVNRKLAKLPSTPDEEFK